MIQCDNLIHGVCLTNSTTRAHTHTLASSVYQPAAAAAHRICILNQSYQLSLQQAQVLLLAAIALPLQLVQSVHWVFCQQPGTLFLGLMLHLRHLKDSTTRSVAVNI